MLVRVKLYGKCCVFGTGSVVMEWVGCDGYCGVGWEVLCVGMGSVKCMESNG